MAQLRSLAATKGHRSLSDDGLLKAAQGLTTIEEVLRAASGIGDDE